MYPVLIHLLYSLVWLLYKIKLWCKVVVYYLEYVYKLKKWAKKYWRSTLASKLLVHHFNILTIWEILLDKNEVTVLISALNVCTIFEFCLQIVGSIFQFSDVLQPKESDLWWE